MHNFRYMVLYEGLHSESHEGAFGPLAHGDALLDGLDTVVHAVADHVHQWVVDVLDDATIERIDLCTGEAELAA